MSRIEKALKELNKALDNGAEFPDIDWKIAGKYKIPLEKLVEAYDMEYQ